LRAEAVKVAGIYRLVITASSPFRSTKSTFPELRIVNNGLYVQHGTITDREVAP
jgi:hypothetical protein